jgi:PAS domain S-box-containing protein
MTDEAKNAESTISEKALSPNSTDKKTETAPALNSAESAQNAEDGVIKGDLWGYITDVNEVILKMYVATVKSEFVGKHVLSFLVKEERRQVVQDTLESITTGKGSTKEYRALSKSGKVLSVLVTMDFLIDENGEKIGFIDIVRTRSER